MKNVIEHTESRRIYLFDGYQELLEAAIAGADPVQGSSHKRSCKRDWDYGAGWKGAVKLAQEGWPEGRNRVREISAHVAEAIPGERKRSILCYDVSGEGYDIGRLVAGDPECAMVFQREPTRTRVARVVASLAASCAITSDQFYRRGAAVCALVDAFECAGVRCEVIAGGSLMCGVFRCGYGCVLKQPDDTLDMEIVTYALAHPAFFRRILFALFESEDKIFRDGIHAWQHRDYGHPDKYAVPTDDAVEIGVPDYDDSAWCSDERMLEWVKKEVKGIVEFQ